MARVALDGVWKIYEQRGRKVEAVRDLILDCADGEFLAIVGPSGCGKSSTMRMIAGLEAISRGTITIGERVVNHIKPADRNIAMVFENYALYPHLTVRDNIVLSLEVRGVSKSDIERLLRRAVATLDIGDILKRKPRQLSGGQKQRVAIARAIVRNPTVLIMDEPISHIDARLRSKVRAELKHLLRELNATTIYVTHNQAEALSMADRIAVMSEGELQQVGTAEEIYEHPANLFVADFVGEPPMNLIPCAPVRDNGHLVLRAGPIAVAPSNRLRGRLEQRQGARRADSRNSACRSAPFLVADGRGHWHRQRQSRRESGRRTDRRRTRRRPLPRVGRRRQRAGKRRRSGVAPG